MEVKTFTPEQLVNHEVVPLHGQALEYFRNLEKFKHKNISHYELLTSPEYFTAEVAVIFSNNEDIGISRKEIYKQLMFYTNDNLVRASKLLFDLTYGKINFISLDGGDWFEIE